MKVVFLCVEGRINWTYHAAFSQEAVQPVMGVRHLYIAGSEGVRFGAFQVYKRRSQTLN